MISDSRWNAGAGVKSAQSKLNFSRLATLVIKRSATYLKDLKITRHFPRVRAGNSVNLKTGSHLS